eukprot:1727736-Pyramimonas_sp.AAC.2
MFEARLVQGGVLKKVLVAVKDMITRDANFNCAATDFSLQAMDSTPARMGRAHFFLLFFLGIYLRCSFSTIPARFLTGPSTCALGCSGKSGTLRQ